MLKRNESYTEKALEAQRGNNIDKADALYEQALKSGEDKAKIYHFQGILRHQAADNQGAIKLILKSLGQRPDYPEALHSLALVYMAIADAEQAEVSLVRALKYKPDYQKAQLLLATVYSKTNQKEKAVSLYRDILRSDPGCFDALYNVGTLKLNENSFAESIQYFEQALKKRQDFAPLFFNYGNALVGRGEVEAAIRYFECATSLESNPSYYVNEGNAYLLLGRFGDAEKAYTNAIKLNPNHVEAFYNLGIVKHKLGDYDSAIFNYGRAIESSGDKSSNARINRGLLYRQQKQYKKSADDLQRAIILNPSTRAHNNYGTVLADIGRFEDAVEHFRRAITLDAQNDSAYANMANCLFLSGKLNEALICIEKALSISPDNQEHLLLDSIINLSAEKYIQALESVRIALKYQGDVSLRRRLIAQHMDIFILSGDRQGYMQIEDEDAKVLWESDDIQFNRIYIDSLFRTKTTCSPFERRNRFYTLTELLQTVLHLEGAIAECGCFKGLSSLLMLNCIKNRNYSYVGQDFYIYDSFEGLSEPSEEDKISNENQSNLNLRNTNLSKQGMFSADEGQVRQTMREFPGVTLKKGWIPGSLKDEKKRKYRFVHVDVDLYDPTHGALEYFWPLMVEGGIIICDDYNWPGARRAVIEFSEKHNASIKTTENNQAYFIK